MGGLAMGFEDGADHFDGGATGFGVAKGGAVFFDGGDEIESGGEVAADLFAEVGDGFFGGEAVAVDGLPGLGGGAGIEGAAATQMGEGFGVDAEVDDALGADELNAETSVARAGVLHGVEKQGKPAFHLEASMGFIAGERTNAFRPLRHVGLGDGLAVLIKAAGAGFGGTEENAGEVEKMTTEDPEVEGAAAGVFLAPTARFEQTADGTFHDEFLHGLQGRVIAVAMGKGELGIAFGAGGDDFIRLLGAAAKGFLHVNAARSGSGGCEDHGVMLIDVTRANGDEVRFDLVQHGGVVEEAVFDLKLGLRCREAFGVGIGDGDETHPVETLKENVEPVSEIAGTGVSDRGGADVLRRSRFGTGRCGRFELGDGRADCLGREFDKRGIAFGLFGGGDIGGEAEAIAWLASDREVKADLPVVDYFPLPDNSWFSPGRWLGEAARSGLGLPAEGPIALDGLVSLWQAR